MFSVYVTFKLQPAPLSHLAIVWNAKYSRLKSDQHYNIGFRLMDLLRLSLEFTVAIFV